jgi:hypothetical protein
MAAIQKCGNPCVKCNAMPCGDDQKRGDEWNEHVPAGALVYEAARESSGKYSNQLTQGRRLK